MTRDSEIGRGDVVDLEKPASVNPLPDAEEMDLTAYLSELEDFDLTEEQKIELLEILVSIMRTFVELGFDAKNWGRIFEESRSSTMQESEGVKFLETPTMETPSEDAGEGRLE